MARKLTESESQSLVGTRSARVQVLRPGFRYHEFASWDGGDGCGESNSCVAIARDAIESVVHPDIFAVEVVVTPLAPSAAPAKKFRLAVVEVED